ncbi:MAG: phytanoyl-CoA dioxygenase family protein [Xanthomonadales bacterium]|nr:phytanoyl-CoA dioxygenase family protein [Xanthomonadales bacterium]MCB1611443.1 phytanoyl-CoA dioxygenase family protein [Xanthomonadales bacterium]MCP5475595.1 phytanoyl-CoA dioxygenase family protein [Rhodanobacteraceae bacterium]
MRALFKSPQLQADFDRDGYVIVPFLDTDQVAELSAHYASLDHDHKIEQGFHVSLDNRDAAFKRAVMDKLLSVTAAPVDTLFDRARSFVASYVVKEPGPRGIVPPHQDWTFVDESQFVSCTVWIPLAPTTVDNGALGVIKGSHRLFDQNRASPSPQCPTPIGDLMFQVFPFLDVKEMQPGQALIFNNRTLHGSPPNLSDVARIAVGIGITHAEAELRHYYLLPDADPQELECYQVEPEFFHQYSNGALSQLYQEGRRPQGQQCIGRTPFVRKPADGAALSELFLRDGNRFDGALAERMARLFAPARREQPVEAVSTAKYVFDAEFPPMKRVFRDLAHQQALERDGYVIVDFLDSTQVATLEQHYRETHPEPVRGFYASTFAPDKTYREAVDRRLREIAKARIEALTQDIKIIFGSYIVKGSDEGSQMNIHQDMTLVDENQFNGINIWCPLTDLDEHNGAIHVLPGSHRLLRTLRGSTLPAIYDGVREELMQILEPVHLRAGQAIIFDQSIIHFSPPNRSGRDRVVINIFFAHQDARMMICYHDRSQPERTVEVFEVDDSLLHVYEHFGSDINARPNVGRSLGTVEYAFPTLTPECLRERYPERGAAAAHSAHAGDSARTPASAEPVVSGWRKWLRQLLAT